MKNIASKFAVVGSIVVLTACMGKPDLEELVEIKPNETSFLIKLEGDTKTGQAKFMSEEFLEQNKVATKRISIPHRKRSTGNGSYDYEWIPTAKLVTVDRTPVSREWTSNEKTGTSAKIEGIRVESVESIDFSIGVVMTASIPEDKAAKFLYNYAGKALKDVADQDIRAYVQAGLSREFGVRTLMDGQHQKKEIFDKVLMDTKAHFADLGVIINNLGYAEGMTYSDSGIQKAINDTYAAQQSVQTAKARVQEATQMRLAAEEFAKAREAQVAKTQLEIEIMKAQAMVEFAKNMKPGMLPNIVPQGSQLLFGLDRPLK